LRRDLCVQNRHGGSERAQLTLHKRRQARPVVAVELLERFDLVNEGDALAFQTPDDVVIPLLSFTLEPSRVGLGVLDYLGRSGARIGQDLVGVASRTVGLRLGLADYLLSRRVRIGQFLAGVLARAIRVRLGVSDYLLRIRPRVRPDISGLVLSTGNMIVGGPLGQNQHLKRLPLRIRIEYVVRVIQCHVIGGRAGKQPFDTALHSTISHQTTSVHQRSWAATCAGTARVEWIRPTCCGGPSVRDRRTWAAA
jgi:hypothetical protein